MKKIAAILRGLKVKQIVGDAEREVAQIVFDSRKATANSLFVAVRGTQVDGHSFILKVIESGAVAVICEELPTDLPENVVFIVVENAAETLGLAAANFYDNPTEKLKVVGITGTNGKTSIATLLYDLFTNMGYKCGLVSTVEYRVAGKILPSTHTTPDQIALQSLFATMITEGCAFAFMEVSSHALEQNRVAGIHFAGGVFSKYYARPFGLSQDI